MAPVTRNVLFLVADDLGMQLGCYGCDAVSTPHIDKLAAEGTLFTRGFASTASCSGSRSTLYTGLHTHQNGQYGLAHDKYHFVTFDHVDTAPKLLNAHGYLTGIVGKVHVGPDAVYPWQVRWETWSQTRDVARIADRCADFFALAKKPGEERPFFLTVGFIDPHRDLTRDGWGNEGPFDERVRRRPYRPDEVTVPDFLTDLPETRREFANYYESISRLDQGVGMVLAELDKAGLRDDTLVVFLSDNGPPFINSKTTLFEAGINLPIVVRHPGSPPGVVNPNMISWIDVLPTILDWTRYETELYKGYPRLGRSFLGILAERDELPGWDRVYGSHTFHEATNYWPTRVVRTCRYKYHRNIAHQLDFPFAADLYGSLTWEGIRNQNQNQSQNQSQKTAADDATAVREGGGDGELRVGGRTLRNYFYRPAEELFDVTADPDELHNLAADPAHAGVVAELRAELEAFQRRSEDLWLYRDGVSVYGAKYLLDQGMRVPDRWELDVERLATRGPRAPGMYAHPPLGREAPRIPTEQGVQSEERK